MLDNSQEVGYNSLNDDLYVEVVKMDEQSPINDTECQHPTLIPDPEDKLDNGSVYHGCANPKCGLGWYILLTQK